MRESLESNKRVAHEGAVALYRLADELGALVGRLDSLMRQYGGHLAIPDGCDTVGDVMMEACSQLRRIAVASSRSVVFDATRGELGRDGDAQG